jgi:hypothetical protein
MLQLFIFNATRPPASRAGPMGRELIILQATSPPVNGAGLTTCDLSIKATRPPASGVSPMGREFRIILRTACGEINNSSTPSFACGRGDGPIVRKIVILKATRPPASGADPMHMGPNLVILKSHACACKRRWSHDA